MTTPRQSRAPRAPRALRALLALLALSGLAGLLGACGEPTQRQSPAARTAAATPSLAGGGDACAFWRGLDGALADWTVSWRRFHPRLDCAAFVAGADAHAELAEHPPVELEPARADEPGVRRIEPPASIPAARGALLLSAGIETPDSEVSLVTNEGGTRVARRLLHCGTACGFDDAAWLQDGRLVVAGWTEHHPAGAERCIDGTPCDVLPRLLVIDLDAGTVTTFDGPTVSEDAFRAARRER